MAQEVVLEEKIQQQVELVEASPQETVARGVGFSQNLSNPENLGLRLRFYKTL